MAWAESEVLFLLPPADRPKPAPPYDPNKHLGQPGEGDAPVERRPDTFVPSDELKKKQKQVNKVEGIDNNKSEQQKQQEREEQRKQQLWRQQQQITQRKPVTGPGVLDVVKDYGKAYAYEYKNNTPAKVLTVVGAGGLVVAATGPAALVGSAGAAIRALATRRGAAVLVTP